MRRAISLARKGIGRVEPNPMVGCVITRGEKIIGEGYHRRFGGPHAEVEALRSCSSPPEGATVYVSLEPCSHYGKTPPCADALIAAKVARVVVGLRDPSPEVDGRGIRRLCRAGITVDSGVEQAAAAELIAPFLTRILRNRPYVIAKWAQSLDGKLATRTGHSQWISGEESRRLVHKLRARVDAVLVGSGTVKRDDPLLTARGVRVLRTARRAVLDGRLRTPNQCQLIDTANEIPTLVITGADSAASPKAQRLRNRGVEVVACRRRRGHLDLSAGLAKLAAMGVTNLLLEGGPTLLTAFIEARLVDEAYIFTAPKLIGGRDAPTAYGGTGAAQINDSPAIHLTQTRRLGDDVLHRLRLTDPLDVIQQPVVGAS